MSLMRQLGKAVFSAGDVFFPKPPGPRILLYHQVGAGLGRQMEVTVADFVWQLDWLAENREVIDLESAVKRWDEPGSERLVVLTFDDGYRDTYTTAFPRLKERGLPFTLYLTTGSLGDDHYLTWDQVAEMVATGLVTIGAHTHNHRDLRHETEEEVVIELQTSNGLIEAHTGEQPAHFAYPWGYWSDAADRIVRATYSTATLGSQSFGRSETFDRQMIYRYPVQLSDGTRWFVPRLRGGLRLEEAVRRRLRAYRGP